MGWEPKDWVAIGLLGFIFLYLILAMTISISGGTLLPGAGERSKEIVIYIVGVLSGYIGNQVRNKE